MKILSNCKIIDGLGNTPIPNGSICIKDGAIYNYGNSDLPDNYPNAEIINTRGMTVLPGLIDCHIHASYSFGFTNAMDKIEKPVSYSHIKTACFLRKLLESGYTTVRDGGGLDTGFKFAINEGLISGPDTLLSLFIVSPPGGIGEPLCNVGVEKFHDEFLPESIINEQNQIKPAINKLVDYGADVIKIAVTGANSIPCRIGLKDPGFSFDEIKRTVVAAHALGKKVMCHACGGPALKAAIEVGVDSIEHGYYLDEMPEMIDLMAKKDIFYVPTCSLEKIVSKKTTLTELQKTTYRHRRKSVQLALKAGVKIVAGSDIMNGLSENFAGELEYMSEAGMNSMQAIMATTSLAAECLGLENKIGSIQKGLRADLIVVDGDPLEDITILQDINRIKLIIKKGDICVNRLK